MKTKFSMWNDHGWTRLCEIDQSRFINLIRIQIITKSGIPIDNEYLTSQGFDLKSRRLQSTLRQLIESKLIEIREQTEQEQTENRVRTDGDQTENRDRTEVDQESGSVESKEVKTKSVTKKRKEKSRKEKIIYVRNNPPLKEEVYKYFYDKLYKFDINSFWGHYSDENINWSNAKGVPMRSWKSTMATWQSNWAEKHPNAEKPGYSGSMGYKRKDGTWSGGGY
jgi:hypothetical protein